MKQKLLENKYINNFYKILMIPSMRILPGTLAFSIVMSIVPMLILITAVCSKFSLSAIDITNFFGSILPHGVEELLLSIFNGLNTEMGAWYIILGFILASNGAHAFILASNTIYEIKSKSYLSGRIKAIFLTIILILLLMFIFVVLAFGNMIVKLILSLKIFISVSNIVYSAFIILKWPLAIVIIFLLIKMLYTISPEEKIPSKYVNKGAIFTTWGIIITTAIYSYYTNNIANYNYIYGNLANIIILMILVYLISYILVIGIAINANMYNIEKNKEEEKK